MSREFERLRELTHLGNHKILHLKAELPKKEFLELHDEKAVVLNHRRKSVTLRLKTEEFPQGCTQEEVDFLSVALTEGAAEVMGEDVAEDDSTEESSEDSSEDETEPVEDASPM